MTDAAGEWEALCASFSKLARDISRSQTVNINANSLKAQTKEVAKQFFRQARPVLLDLALPEALDALTKSFQSLLELSDGNNSSASYKRHIKGIKKQIPRITSRIEVARSVVSDAQAATDEDARLITTLESLVPSAARSYTQAIYDLGDEHRVSFRGPALELREALRETLDHLAPDDDVTASEGYANEKGRAGPTMKQKVRFILRARGQSKSSTAVPEQTTSTVDEMIGTLTRSVYERSSVATHVALERKTVIQIRRYVIAVLHDILEL